MVDVGECDVPVVTEEYLDDAGQGAALLKIPTYTISDWGAPRHFLPPAHSIGSGGKSFQSHGQWI